MRNLGEFDDILGKRPDIAEKLQRLEALREIEDRLSGRSTRLVVLDSGTGSTTGAFTYGNVSTTD